MVGRLAIRDCLLRYGRKRLRLAYAFCDIIPYQDFVGQEYDAEINS